jgi:hypothetical protein
VFGSDTFGNLKAWMEFVSNPDNYKDLWQPAKVAESTLQVASFFSNPKKWNGGKSRNKAEVTIINEIEKDEKPRKGERTGGRPLGLVHAS